MLKMIRKRSDITMITKHYTITGVVQGVWFRDFVTKEATRLKLTGTVSNMPDGTVTVVAQGEKASIITFEAALHDGSPLATVVSVESKVITDCSDTYFDFKQIRNSSHTKQGDV